MRAIRYDESMKTTLICFAVIVTACAASAYVGAGAPRRDAARAPFGSREPELAQLAPPAAQQQHQLAGARHAVWLAASAVDTARQEPLDRATVAQTARGTAVLIVQYTQTLDAAGRAALDAAGCVVRGYVPHNAYLIEAPTARLNELRALRGVRWVGEYKPAYKLSHGLIEARHRYQWQAERATRTNDFLADTEVPFERKPLEPPALDAYITVTVHLFDAGDLQDVMGHIAALGGTDIGGAVYDSALGRTARIRARVSFDSLDALAARPEVQWVEQFKHPQLLNNVAVQPHLMNVTPVWETNWLGLTGRGQIVAHADTGLDTGNLLTLHPDFTNRLRAVFGLWRTGGKWNDPDGHGTHSAGSLAGNGSALSNGLFKAPAYEAQLVHQSLYYDASFPLVVPTNLQELFQQTYATNARIQSCSWGYYNAGDYDGYARDVDQFMWEHPDMLIVLAAGNGGADGYGNGVVAKGSLISPGSAKNAMTVGASESDRPAGSGGYSSSIYGSGAWEPLFPANPIHDDLISTSADGIHQGMFAASSRGPCKDGRIKPDIVAPGTDIISCRSRVSGAGTLWGVYNNNYVFSGGTSMATPLAASAAALVRQYFAEKHSTIISNPSAALVKAVLLNGARSLSPGQYGYEQYREIPARPRPNVVEGWGQVNLAATLTNLTVWDMQPMVNGMTTLYEVVVAETNVLSVLLAWTDFPGTLGAAQALVNDLDLQVILPDGTVHFPNGLAGPDKTNNVEGIDFDMLPPGVCTVQVSGVINMGSTQHYALVVRGAAPVYAKHLVESTDYHPKTVRPVHAPVISAVVKTNASGVAAVTLHYRVNAGPWQMKAMAVRTPFESGGVYTNVIPAQAKDAVVQFFVTANANDGAYSSSRTNQYTVGDYAVFVWRGGSQTAPYDTWATGFSNIYQAIASSFVMNGYVIYVTNGVYSARDSGVDDGIIVNKAVHLIGVNGAQETIIDGRFAGRVLTIINPGAVVQGFTIQRGYVSGVNEGGGVYMQGGTLRNCVVRDCYVNELTSNGGGVYMSDGLVDACVIRDNHSWGAWEGNAGGASAYGKGVVRSSVLINNEARSSWRAYGGNVGLFRGGVMSNCTVAGGTAVGNLGGGGGGVYINFTGTVHNSIVYHNNNGNHLHYSNNTNLLALWSYSCTTPQPSGEGIIVVSTITSAPLLMNHTGYDGALQAESPCRNAGQWQAWMTNAMDAAGHPRIVESNVDMGALEYGPLSVSFLGSRTNGLTPLPVIFSTFVSGQDTNNVHFYWDFNYDGSNELSGTAWARPTNIYAEGMYSVRLFASNETGESTSWLRDYYIYAFDTNLHYAAHGGAHRWPFTSLATAATNIQDAIDACISGHSAVVSNGVYRLPWTLQVPSGVTLRGLHGRDATVLDGRGAMRCVQVESGAVVDGLTLSNGYYSTAGIGGGGVYFYGGGTVRNARIIKCGGIWGGGVYFNSGGLLEDSLVENNSVTDYGGGAYMRYGGTINRCRIIGNTATGSQGSGGGVYVYNAGAVVRNSVLATNTAHQYGGAAFLGNTAGGTFENCTIVANRCNTANNGGGMYCWSSTITMRNCIVYHNTAGSAPNNMYLSSVTKTMENLCTTPPEGSQCLSNDPRLVSISTRDYRLRGDSYCVNAGKNLSWMSGATDVDGNARIINGAPDIGAYELSTNAPLLRVMASASDPHQLGTLNLGTAPFDTTNSATLVVRNVGGASLNGAVGVPPGPFWCASATNFSLGVNASTTLTFRFSPTAVGTFSEKALFSGGGGAEVTLRGTGIPEPACVAILLALAVWRARRA